MPTNTSSNNGDRDDEIFVENVPSPPVAEVANGAADDDSLSSENLMATMSPHAAADAAEEEDDEDDDSPGEVQLYAEDDSKVKPADRPIYFMMMAKGNVPDFDPEEFADFATRANNKKLMKPTKAMAMSEIKRQNPRTKFDRKNTRLDKLLNMLTPLDDEKDIAYLTRKVAEIKRTLLATIAVNEAGTTTAAHLTPKDRMRWTGLHTRDDVLQLFWRSQDSATREEIDAGETPLSKYHDFVVEKFNNVNVQVTLDPIPSLGYTEPILCEKGDYILTVEKSKKLASDIRRNLNGIIDRYERSGNGSNQHAHNRGELELEEGVSIDSLWGRTIHAQRQPNAAAAAAAGGSNDGAAETEDGDDRGNFLRSEPKDTLVTWHVFDKLDLIRKICAKLGESHRASSDSTPASTARGSHSRKTPRQSEPEDSDAGMTPKEFDQLILKAQKIRRLDRQVTASVERLDQLTSERFELYLRAEDEVNERKRQMFSHRCQELSTQIRGGQQLAWLGITTRQFITLQLCAIIACNLVKTTKTTPGSSSVSCPEEVCREDFLKRYGLCNGNKGHCEITTGNIKYKYLEDDRSIHPMPTEWTKMKLLRIGKYKARGETATATLQINSDHPPPYFNYKPRTPQRKLVNDVNDSFSKYLFHEDKCCDELGGDD